MSSTVEQIDSDGQPALAVRLAVGVALAGAALWMVLANSLQGAVVVILTSDNGVHTGDLLAFALLVTSYHLVVAGPGSWVQRGPSWPGRQGGLAMASMGAALSALAVLEVSDAADGLDGVEALALSVGIVTVAGCVSVALLEREGRRIEMTTGERRPAVLAVLVVLLGGYVLDTLLLPSGTVMGPTALAAFLALARPRGSRSHYLLLTGALLLVNVAALADQAGLDVTLASAGGGVTRTLALGTVLAVGGIGDRVVPRPGGASGYVPAAP